MDSHSSFPPHMHSPLQRRYCTRRSPSLLALVRTTPRIPGATSSTSCVHRRTREAWGRRDCTHLDTRRAAGTGITPRRTRQDRPTSYLISRPVPSPSWGLLALSASLVALPEEPLHVRRAAPRPPLHTTTMPAKSSLQKKRASLLVSPRMASHLPTGPPYTTCRASGAPFLRHVQPPVGSLSVGLAVTSRWAAPPGAPSRARYRGARNV